MRARVAILALITAAAACKERGRRDAPAAGDGDARGPIDPISVRVSELLADLRSLDAAARGDAIDQIRGLTSRRALAEEEGIALLRALPELEAHDDTPPDPQTAIVAALADDLRMSYLPVIEDVAARLRPAARRRAIAAVGMVDDPTAARTFLRLLGRFPADPPALAFAHLRASPQQPRVLFPAMLDLADHPLLFEEVLATALAYCERGRLRREALSEHAAAILEHYRDAAELLGPKQRATGTAWMWTETYAAERDQAAIVLDLMGCMPEEVVLEDLRAALAFQDPRLLYAATRSLLTHGEPPPPKVLDRIAAAPETRGWLLELLDDAGRRDLFPARWLTQPALAEAALAAWLARPDQVGRPPDELELVEVVPIDAGPPDGVLDFYVFRFRYLPPHERAAAGWLAGVAGPYLRAAAPTTADHGGTFSAYERFDARTAADHVGAPAEILDDWRAFKRRR